MISTRRDGNHGLDLEHHLQGASKAFWRKQIDSNWYNCVHCATPSLFWRYDETSCLFCKWPSQNLQTGPLQIGHQIPQTRARHCGPSWWLRFFFVLTPFCRDKVSRSCFTGQLPGIGTVFILDCFWLVSFKEVSYWRQLPLCFQRTIGIRMNCWWQSNDWKLTNLLMRKGLLQSCYILLLTTSSTDFWDFSMVWCILRNDLLTGAKLFSICCQNMAVRRFLLSIGPLQASAFCTRRLLIWFWVVLEPFLEAAQPEEQRGFRSGRCIEEHLVIDKPWSVNMPIWIISLDLSKAFDRLHWPALWWALSQQSISDHMVWLLQNLYKDQTGQIAGTNESSRLFDIKRGVRQGCVLTPRLFCAVLEMAMGMWRRTVGGLGLDLGDGGPTLLNLRFADDILIFATTCIDAGLLLDELVVCLSQVGLVLNTDKTKVMTCDDYGGSTAIISVNPSWFTNRNSWPTIMS